MEGPRIICHIGEDKPRFNGLRDMLENVSRVCWQSSSANPADGLVIRTQHPKIPRSCGV